MYEGVEETTTQFDLLKYPVTLQSLVLRSSPNMTRTSKPEQEKTKKILIQDRVEDQVSILCISQLDLGWYRTSTRVSTNRI